MSLFVSARPEIAPIERAPRLLAPRLLALLAASIGGAMLAASPSGVPVGCRLDEGPSQMLRVYECQEQLRVAAEASARLTAIERGGRLVGLNVEGGAVLVEGAGRRESFRIVAANTVTELREGQVAVDAGGGSTAVFVRRGNASVSRDGEAVALKAGEGVDVASGATPVSAPAPRASSPATRSFPRAEPPSAGLQARTWGAGRAGSLMARLGGS